MVLTSFHIPLLKCLIRGILLLFRGSELHRSLRLQFWVFCGHSSMMVFVGRVTN